MLVACGKNNCEVFTTLVQARHYRLAESFGGEYPVYPVVSADGYDLCFIHDQHFVPFAAHSVAFGAGG